MTVSTKNIAMASAFNLPNQLTAMRLALSVVLFALIALKFYLASFVVFLVAASTDWVDGYLARRYSMVTTLGRILDPFADKIIVCGSFIFLAAIPELHRYLPAWMVVVIVGRELLVTALRSFLEQQGADFSATMSGKLKMVLQCVAIGTALFYLSYEPDAVPEIIEYLLLASVWAAVLLTIYSGYVYVRAAVNMMNG
ncbi:MAG: CDP-diacylglycerol--glycerol-3-phosphate 3-phosphatidyltransferase [Singulisphaera sp.]